ncbi:hypothetical protein [Ruegeria lacuscaerulensis]|uniref:hypothetical protein n=1 Tax=Ruegeria lacuscaerulensis TaxID=55218 RepID=UPI00147C0EDB|nr:hypothetical protein [Ruegeria lacuscaerulensis]
MADVKAESPYSQRDLGCAVKLSALLGWVGVIGVPLFASLSREALDVDSVFLVFWYALFGLPISFFICWLLVKPFLRFMMRCRINYIRAAIWGAGIAVNLIAIRLTFRFFRSWLMSQDPKSTSSYGDGTDTISINGVYTDYGWWVFAKNSLNFVAICILSALVVRLIIGPGSSATNTEAKL